MYHVRTMSLASVILCDRKASKTLDSQSHSSSTPSGCTRIAARSDASSAKASERVAASTLQTALPSSRSRCDAARLSSSWQHACGYSSSHVTQISANAGLRSGQYGVQLGLNEFSGKGLSRAGPYLAPGMLTSTHCLPSSTALRISASERSSSKIELESMKTQTVAWCSSAPAPPSTRASTPNGFSVCRAGGGEG